MSRFSDRILVLCGILRLELAIATVLCAAYVAVTAGTSIYFGQVYTIDSFQRALSAIGFGLWKPAFAVVGMTAVWCIFGPFEMNHADAKAFFFHPFRQILGDLRKPLGKRKRRDE